MFLHIIGIITLVSLLLFTVPTTKFAVLSFQPQQRFASLLKPTKATTVTRSTKQVVKQQPPLLSPWYYKSTHSLHTTVEEERTTTSLCCHGSSSCFNSYRRANERTVQRRNWGIPNLYVRYMKVSSSSSMNSSDNDNSDTDNNNNNNNNNYAVVGTFIDNSSSNNNNNSIARQESDDQMEAIQMIFTNNCDADGLMTKQDVMKKVPFIVDLLLSGDLLIDEFGAIFDKAPKFPDPSAASSTAATTSTSTTPDSDSGNADANGMTPVTTQRTSSSNSEERIDIDSFVQIYRDIDDLFEADDDDKNNFIDNNNSKREKNTIVASDIATVASATSTKPLVVVNSDTAAAIKNDDDAVSTSMDRTSSTDDDEELLMIVDDNSDGDEPDPSLEAELEAIYESLCDTAGYITREQLRNWDEVDKLVQDGLLGEDEFQELWSTTSKSNISENKLDVDGFLSFNVALDDLFTFDDEEMEDEYVDQLEIENDSGNDNDGSASSDVDTGVTQAPLLLRKLITGEGLSPDQLFVALANADGLIGIEELQQWRELQEMVTDGDVLESEILDMYKTVQKSEMDLNKLNVDGFTELYAAVNNLFEDDNDDTAIETTIDGSQQQPVTHKIELLDAIADLGRANELPCGLDATELEQREILSIVEMVENDTTAANLIRMKRGMIDPQELSGEWELIYSSSSAMKFNQGLSGLGGSVPNGRFGTLKQKLIATKYLTDVEYTERIETNPSSASFDVTVTGTWDLRTSVSLFTGEPSIVMNVVPDRVTYGPTSTRADHWKSLGPMNMLDISYLDDNLRIMRGNTSIDTIFIFRRM